MKTNNIFLQALMPRSKHNSKTNTTYVRLIDLAGLAGLVMAWNWWQPIFAVATYLLFSRLVNYRLQRGFASKDLASYRIVIDAAAGLEIIILSLVYSLNNFERLGALISPSFAPDESAVTFSLATLLTLTVLLICYLVLRVYLELRSSLKPDPWSNTWFEKIEDVLQRTTTLFKRLLKPFNSFRLSSYAELSPKGRLYILIRGLIFPVGVLAPYFLLHNEYKVCSFGGSCLVSDGSGAVQNIVILTFLLAIIVASLLRTGPSNYQALRRFVRWQVVVSAVAFAVTLAAYTAMYPLSQGAGTEIIMVEDSQITVLNEAYFGTGLPHDMVLGLSVFYLLLPLIRWYRVLFSRNYIDGTKKQELFQ